MKTQWQQTARDVSFNGINRISVKKNVNGQKLQQNQQNGRNKKDQFSIATETMSMEK